MALLVIAADLGDLHATAVEFAWRKAGAKGLQRRLTRSPPGGSNRDTHPCHHELHIIALVSGVVSLAAIRSKDFAHQQDTGPAGPTTTGQPAAPPEHA
jgi:hypothetical protein